MGFAAITTGSQLVWSPWVLERERGDLREKMADDMTEEKKRAGLH